MRFQRSEGLTPSEILLAGLCDASFLKLWTYPNLYKEPGKELADLIVVFDQDVLIFSDKSCAYPDAAKPLAWSRWYRRAVSDSAKQIRQAENWLARHPGQVFLDAKCQVPLPLTLPPAATMKVHRICVVTGVAAVAGARGLPGLALEPDVAGHDKVFTIGQIPEVKGLVHVFDEASLKTVMTQLSTIADFVAYLDAKAALIAEGGLVRAETEVDLLAIYLWHNRTFPVAQRPYTIEPGSWATLAINPQFVDGQRANRTSFFWDGLIDYVTNHFLGGTLEFGNDLAMGDHERLVRIMAGETRFWRRVLVRAIVERRERAREASLGAILPSERPAVLYVLYVGRGDQGGDHDAYRKERVGRLYARCMAAKAKQPEVRFIVGLALDAAGVRGSSEDFLFMDTEDWTDAELAEAVELRRALDLFSDGNVVASRLVEDEYPIG